MAEQSHLEAMREAIKGDLERARARRPSIFERTSPPPVEIRNAPAPAAEPAVQAAQEPEPEPVAVEEPVEEEPVAAEPEPEEPVAETPEPEAPEPDPEPVTAEARKSLLRRLLFWR